MRFWLWFALLYALMVGGIVVMAQGGTVGSVCRDASDGLRRFGNDSQDSLGAVGTWLRDTGRAINDACSHRRR